MSIIHTLAGALPPARYDAVAWTSVRVEEAAAQGGPFDAVATLALSPVDANPAAPQSRDLTFAATLAAGWYRLVWLDPAANASPPSGAVYDDGTGTTAVQFASADDLAMRLGITLGVDEVTRADGLLRLASGLIQREAGQTLAFVVGDTLTVRAGWGDRLRLPQRPVVSVASVTLGGTLLGSSEWQVLGDELVRAAGWSGLEAVVVYTHGFAEVPPLVKAICLEVVIRAWTNPAAVEAEQYGNAQISYGSYRTRGGMLLTDAERDALRSAFGRSLGTIVLH